MVEADKGLTQDASHAEKISVRSLGSSLSRHDIALWKDIEKRLFQDEPYYIYTSKAGEPNEETEFFVLYDGDLAVGRATASINHPWIQQKGHNLGFINDFLVSSEHKDYAGLIIDRCLASLRTRGVEGAVVRAQGFPVLAAQDLGGDVAPFCMPGNPPWYIDLFEQKGFVKYKEWANFRMPLPRRIPKDVSARSKRSLKHLDLKSGNLRMRSRRQVDDYHDLNDIIMQNHFGYTYTRFVGKDDPRLKHLLFIVMSWLLKFHIYVLTDSSGRVVGSATFAPNMNVALRPLMHKPSGLRMRDLPRFLISLRRVKRVEIATIGLVPEMRNKGLVSLMDETLRRVVDRGYKELDTGPIMAENRVVMRMVQYIEKKYEIKAQHMKYYTLLLRF